MKRTVFTFIVFAFFANVSAQIKVNSSGNVGIGKDPQYKLDVAGDIYMGSASNILGTTNNNAITFKVNNIMAGFTGSNPFGNVSFGFESLLNPSVGSYNTAFGSRALTFNTSDYNVALGSSALHYNTGGNSNVASGTCALYLNTTGSHNTASGHNSLIGNTTGSYNTGFGRDALQDNTTGSYNTAIGYHAGANNPDNLTNTTTVGHGAAATASYQVRIGNYNVSSIGGYAGWTNLSDKRAKKNVRTDVPGLAFINGLQPVTYNLDLDAMDILLKIDKTKKPGEKELSPDLTAINQKAREAKEKQIQSGFLAQDVEQTAKSIGYDFSGVDVDETGIYGLRYAEFVVPLVKAVQELSAQNRELVEAIQEQQRELSDLKLEMAAVKGKSSSAGLRSSTGMMDLSAQCVLTQNAPNPFTGQTEIKYFVVQGVKESYICIFDMQGRMLQKLNATVGQNSVIINGSTLQAGIYLYSLVVDGKEVDTKRMILTK